MRLYRRLTLVARKDQIEKIFYQVFPPARHASEVLAWLTAHAGSNRDLRRAAPHERDECLSRAAGEAARRSGPRSAL